MSFNFTVVLLPPSVNHYKRPAAGGGWFVSSEAKTFIDAVCIFSHRTKVTGTAYTVEITFYLGPQRNKGQNDLDNYSKVAIDALVHAGIIKNDALITDLFLHKRYVGSMREERTEYSIDGRSE